MLCCHRRLRDLTRSLDASIGASGPHAFAVRSRAVRYRHYQRPPRPAPRFVTIASAPLGGTGCVIHILIYPSGKAKYFLFWGLTRFP